MEHIQMIPNLTEAQGGQPFSLLTSLPSLIRPNDASRVYLWMYFIFAPASTGFLWMFWKYVVRLYLVRRFYEKQGIRFVRNSYPILGPEMFVNGLVGNNKTHDWLYTERPTDLYGSVRGFSVQLYTTDAESCEELISKTGHYVDRDTPAKYSFGRMSPHALTFYYLNEGRFKERKVTLTQGLKDSRRLYEILQRQAQIALERFSVKSESGTTINIRDILDSWTRESSGEQVWGSNIKREIKVYDISGQLKSMPFMEALNETFTDLRFNAFRFWHRVCFPLAAMPLSKESRRLGYNVKIIRKAVEDMMTTPEPRSVASVVQKTNESLGIPKYQTRDDLMTATIAALDTIKSAVMEALFHLLSPENASWKQRILDEIKDVKERNGDLFAELPQMPVLSAFLLETLRYEPPGSLFNNRAVKDFDLSVHGKQYKIKAGTRIVTSIHGLHQNEENWRKRVGVADMAPLTVFDPNRFLKNGDAINSSGCFMPFGKGPRRCPGQGAGLMMTKVFLVAFLNHNPNCRLVLPDDLGKDAAWFNLYSRAGYEIVCDDKPGTTR